MKDFVNTRITVHPVAVVSEGILGATITHLVG
jgi:hypothetical protein